MRYSAYNLIAVIFGFAFGIGHLTSLRFAGPIGLSEILVGGGIFLLASVILRMQLPIYPDFFRSIAIFLGFLIVLVAPLVTAITYFFSDFSDNIFPEYILSFIASVALMLLFRTGALADAINFRLLAIVFVLVFSLANVYAALFSPSDIVFTRFHGGANNPNQLLVYIYSAAIFVALYARRYVLYALPILVYWGIQSGSDAFALSVVMGVGFFLFFVVSGYISRGTNVHASSLVFFIALFIVLILPFFDISFLSDDWSAADEGGLRGVLLKNGLLAAAHSPVLGNGVGSFSGILTPFEGKEAHNTFVDFAVQFGFPFAICIFFIQGYAAFQALRRDDFLLSVLFIAFMLTSLFHFVGRHFVYWAVLGVALAYISPILFQRKTAILE